MGEKRPSLRKIRYENSSSPVIFVLRRSRTFYPIKLLVWMLNYVHKQWFCTKIDIEDFLLLLNAEKAISTEFPVSFSLRPKLHFFRLVCSSTARIGTQTPKTKIYTNPGKVFTGLYLGMGGFDHF